MVERLRQTGTVTDRAAGATIPEPTIMVLDDDPCVRDVIAELLLSVGLRVEVFDSAAAFLRAGAARWHGCLVLDVRLPGQSGLDLQDELARSGIGLPIIFITGHGDIQMSVQAMKAGAVEFLTKPFRDQDLLDAIQIAIGRDRARLRSEAMLADLERRLARLTAREREVMQQVVLGRPNKRIAGDLGLSEITVKAHRGQVMRKMKARSLAELVRMSDKLAVGDADAWAA